MIPVVVGTNPDRHDWLSDCLKSIRRTSKHRRVLVHDTGGYEISALRTGIRNFRTFILLHDSCEVLSTQFWDVIDNSGPTWLFGPPHMYLAIYDSHELEKAIHDAPEQMDKSTSIHWEGELGMRLQLPTIWPEVIDANGQYQERHGRNNLVLGNQYARKWKGNWGQ